MALAKGLTGGYLPLAATLTTERIFAAFLGRVEEMKTFYYGHSYCGNPLGCAAALANLDIFESEATLTHLAPKIAHFRDELAQLKSHHPHHIGQIRQIGMIAGIDILKDAPTETPYPWSALIGAKICQEARKHGLLTRPIRDTIVLMPPLCITHEEISHMVGALDKSLGTCIRDE
jgi:adenosylmethionine-8-amino-7-oxononanoate aminotransferase